MQSTESDPEEAKPRSKSRRKYKRWIVLAGLAGGLVWLNGPGLRWLAPKVAGHFFQKAGIRGTFTLEGSLTGGISVKDLRLETDKSLEDLSVDRATPDYQIIELCKGKVRGIVIEGLHVNLRLGIKDEETPDKPFVLEQLVQTLRDVRKQLVPLSVDLRNISLNAAKEGKPALALAPSSLRHVAGDTNIALELGAITDATGRVWPAQKSTIVWKPDDLSIQQIDPLPGVSIRDLMVRLPASGGPSAETELRIDDAVFMLASSPGFSSVRMDLREGRLASTTLAERFALDLPASAELTSLSLNVDGLLPDPAAATGEVRLLFDDVRWQDWTVPELSLDLELQADQSSVAASGQALGSGFSFHAEAPITRTGTRLIPGDVRGNFNLADVPKIVAALAGRTQAIDPAAPVPPSSVDGKFHIPMKDMRPSAADLTFSLIPAEPEVVSPVAVKARWQPDRPFSAEVGIDGLKGRAEYDPKPSSYQAGLDFDQFKSTRIDRWLAIFKATSNGAVSLTGTWKGGGELAKARHHGSLTLAGAEFAREGVPPIQASGGIDYDWPARVETKDLKIQSKDQTVSVDAKLADGILDLTNLRWQDRQTEMAGGSARLPVPKDFAKWKEMLTGETRALELSVKSEVLSLALLKDWIPAAEKLDPRSTGRVTVKVSGTYGDPEVDMVLEAMNLRSPEQPKLPPADLKLTVAGKAGRITLTGSAMAPDFPAARMSFSMPFRPAEWAENPEIIASEPLTARVDLPRIDLSRFGSLVSQARKVSGTLTGSIDVAGNLGNPAIKGRIDLSGGGFELKDQRYPEITGIAATVDLGLEKITLRNLKAGIAGGTLQGSGSIVIEKGPQGALKPGPLDIRVTANHLPLLRNDSLIVRTNADLRLAGTWERAALTGTVDVVDSLFYRDIELLPIGTPFTAPSAAALPKIDSMPNPAAAMPEPFRNWTLNVTARTGNPFLIRGNFATGRIEANVRLGGTLGSPAPDGEVKISDFRAALPFSTLTIRSGTIRFDSSTGFDPVLEIRGRAEPRPYQVSVFVYGRASNPQLVLTSNPPLPENEIMTLLATGTTTSGLENSQAASSRAMQLLAEELRRGRFVVGKQLRPLLALLDRVDFSVAESDPYTSESFSTATIAITDRWFLSAGMGADGDSRVLGIWRLRFH